ncbi:MAG: exo-alpha-sialidase [Pseudomonadota bacterium]
MDQIVIAGLIGLSLLLSAVAIVRRQRPEWRFAMESPPDPACPPGFQTLYDYKAQGGQAHAPFLLVSGSGLELLWFEGSAEAQADVDIHAVRLSRSHGAWHAGTPGPRVARRALGAAMTPRQLVVTLGNMIDAARPDRIFLTVVSVGGWAMASVAEVTLSPGGVRQARKLNLSPVLNRSFLIKSPVVAFQNGLRGVPAYFEMGPTYGALVQVDAQGRVRDMSRIAGPGRPIQPMIVPFDALNAVAFLRDFNPSGALWMSETTDGGRHWSFAHNAGLPNPSAPVAALRLDDGSVLVAANDDPHGGDRLSLLIWSRDAASWRRVHELEPNGAGARYPVMRVHPDGEIVLAYSTGNKKGLRVHLFSRAWAEAAST